MIFETKSGRYWPIDDSAHQVMAELGFIAPLDWQAYETMVVMLKHQGQQDIDLWDEDNPFCLPPVRS